MRATLRERIAAGDRHALAEAFVAYRPLARKILRQRGRNPNDFDDLIQDAFMLLPRAAQRCAPSTTIGGCVAATVIQACMTWDARKATHGHERWRVRPKAGELERIPEEATHPEEATSRRERVHYLSELVEQLPDRQRDMLIARELHGLKPDELARRFDSNPRACVNTVLRARARLEELAANSPLAEVFAAMPKRRTRTQFAHATPASLGMGTRGGLSPSGSFNSEGLS